jgi:diamine N-acetyltransferase
MEYKLQNDRIGIRETTPGEVRLVSELENVPENQMYIIPYPADRHLRAIRDPEEAHLIIQDKATGVIIGFTILAGLENPNKAMEFRRLVICDKGRGYGRQCLRLVKAYCFDTLHFHRLWLDVFENNEKALHLYTSEGFRIDGRIRDAVKECNGFRTLLLLSVLENEYRNK